MKKVNGKKLELYLVIGNSNMGKSSVLRHVGGFPKGYPNSKNTGKFQLKNLQFTNQNYGDFGLLGYCSLQEMGIDPSQFVALVNNSPNCPDRIFVPLQEISSCKCSYNAFDYVKVFLLQGWQITASVLLNTNHSNHLKVCTTYPNCIYVYSTLGGQPVHPTNVVARDTRNHFGLV